jgi:hypothetical protein
MVESALAAAALLVAPIASRAITTRPFVVAPVAAVIARRSVLTRRPRPVAERPVAAAARRRTVPPVALIVLIGTP